jgi:hypothetical protein
MTGTGDRLSLVCEQYNLEEQELEEIPEFIVESRANTKAQKLRPGGG